MDNTKQQRAEAFYERKLEQRLRSVRMTAGCKNDDVHLSLAHLSPQTSLSHPHALFHPHKPTHTASSITNIHFFDLTIHPSQLRFELQDFFGDFPGEYDRLKELVEDGTLTPLLFQFYIRL